jgi:hypothetical protein
MAHMELDPELGTAARAQAEPKDWIALIKPLLKTMRIKNAIGIPYLRRYTALTMFPSCLGARRPVVSRLKPSVSVFLCMLKKSAIVLSN